MHFKALKYINGFARLLFVVIAGNGISSLQAQGDRVLRVDSIVIEGHQHSEPFIIERELLLKKDSVYPESQLAELSRLSENLLLNTNLYLTVQVSWQEYRPEHLRITVLLREKWYKWVIPVFQLADRNYKQWSEKDYALNRTNYGAHLNLYNFRGRNETIKLTFINGYTRDYGLVYIMPFLDKQGKYGLDISTSFNQNKEIWYLTRNDKLQFYKNFENTLIQRFENHLALTVRKNNFTFEQWQLEYNVFKINDTLQSVALNPRFLLAHDKQTEVFIHHTYTIEKRDNKFYPLTGYYIQNELQLGNLISDTAAVEMLRETVEAGVYQSLAKKLYLSGFFKFSYCNQPKPFIPYNNYKAFGYDNYVRGYEQYVMDGHGFALAKINLKYALLHRYMIKTPFKMNKQKVTLPFGMYVNVFADWGEVFNEQWRGNLNVYNNRLINKALLGYGTGLDFLFLNDKVLRFEYALNILGDKNFNLGLKKAF